jgi:hypothetical protein
VLYRKAFAESPSETRRRVQSGASTTTSRHCACA